MKTNILVLVMIISTITISQTSWQQTNGPFGASIYSILKSGENIFIGCYGGGVYLSTNNGDDWIEKNSGLNKSVYKLAVYEDKLFAATRYGLYVSTDMGNTWEKITNGIPDIWIYTLSVVDSTVFAGTWGVGIYRSTDKGETWAAINNGLNPANICCIAGEGEDVYCGTYGGGIYHSSNKGDSWSQVSNGIGDMYTYTIAIKDNIIYAGQFNSGLYKSTDKGQHWENIPAVSAASINNVLLNEQEIYVSCNAGIYYSDDNGTGWTLIKTPYEVTKTILVYDEFIFAGTYAGIFRSSDDGVNWTDINTNLKGIEVYCLASDLSFMYAGSYASGIFRSADGVNWSRLPDTLIRSSIQTIVISEDDIFLGTWRGGLLKSTNHGDNWISLNNGISPGTSFYSIAVHGNEIYAGSAGNGIYYSSDYGANWIVRNNGLTNLSVRHLMITGTNIIAGSSSSIFYSSLSDTIWTKIEDPDLGSYISSLAMKDNRLFSGDTVIIVSTDNGLTWNKIGTGLPERYLMLVYGGTDYLWAAYEESGVYFSSDMGETWSDYTAELNKEIMCLYEKDGYIYAGTVFNGIWRRPLPEIVSSQEKPNLKPETFFLYQNYPNPFNPNTVIKYKVPFPAHVRIKITDLLGRELKTLVDEYKSAGTFHLEFHSGSLPSGVYFYEIQAGEYSDTKKMIIVK